MWDADSSLILTGTLHAAADFLVDACETLNVLAVCITYLTVRFKHAASTPNFMTFVSEM